MLLLLFLFILMLVFFFFHVPAIPDIYTFPYTTLFRSRSPAPRRRRYRPFTSAGIALSARRSSRSVTSIRRCRSEEHTSELQSRPHLVCRLLLEKKKKIQCLYTTLYNRLLYDCIS